eukprot:1245755-Alexandrium_andersonii.AAC.1
MQQFPQLVFRARYGRHWGACCPIFCSVLSGHEPPPMGAWLKHSLLRATVAPEEQKAARGHAHTHSLTVRRRRPVP